MNSPARSRHEPVIVTTLCVMLTLWVLRVAAAATSEIPLFDGIEYDGNFQFYNALRRLSGGQRPGRDFLLFHGPGIPYLHYPLFRLLGSTFVAAEWARVWPSLVLYPLSIFVFFSTVAKRRFHAFGLTVIALLLTSNLTSLFAPGASLLGIRAFAPLLAIAALMARGSERRRGTLVSASLALALILGFDQALSVIPAVVLATLLFARSGARWRASRWLIVVLGSAFAVAFACLLAMGGLHGAVAMIRYQLLDLPHDQMWFYGVPPDDFIGTWRDLALVKAEILPVIAAIAILGCLWRKHVRQRAGASRRTVGLFALVSYGLVACAAYLGYIDPKYGHPLHRSIILALCAMLYLNVARRRGRSAKVQRVVAAIQFRAVALAATVVTITAVMLMVPSVRRIARAQSAPSFSPRMLRDQSIADSVLAAVGGGKPSTVRVWSAFVGLLDARRGVFQPAPDYMIHALGDAGRERYLDDFRRWNPDVVQTYQRAHFIYEEPLQTRSWRFYELLLANYTVAALQSERILWTRRPNTAPRTASAPVSVVVDPASPGRITLPDPPSRSSTAGAARVIQVVELAYTTTNPWSALPVVGRLPRFFIDVGNAENQIPVSLPPSARRASFPVYRDGRSAVTLSTRITSLVPGATLRIDAVTVRTLMLSGADTILVSR